MWIELNGTPISAAELVRHRAELWRARLGEGEPDLEVADLDAAMRLRGIRLAAGRLEAESG